MSIRIYKPTTPGRRSKTSIVDFKQIAKKKPEKKLTIGKKRISGRSKGKITVRHRGGGAKRKYRQIDFKQDKFDIPAEVLSIEYDPNRSSYIALIRYQDGEKKYIIAPQDLKVGDKIISSRKEKIEIKSGNRFLLKYIPLGMNVYNVELEQGRGAKMARSAGNYVNLLAIEEGYAHLKLPSGEIRKVKDSCMASIGQVSKPEHKFIRLGKAGRKRWKGRRPEVRGKAMNPCSHPHGGGEGRSPIGLKHPKTKWGKPALGVKTRKKKKWTNKLIIKRRK